MCLSVVVSPVDNIHQQYRTLVRIATPKADKTAVIDIESGPKPATKPSCRYKVAKHPTQASLVANLRRCGDELSRAGRPHGQR